MPSPSLTIPDKLGKPLQAELDKRRGACTPGLASVMPALSGILGPCSYLRPEASCREGSERQAEQRERVASLEGGLAEIVAIAEAATSDAATSYGAAVESLQVQPSTRVPI